MCSWFSLMLLHQTICCQPSLGPRSCNRRLASTRAYVPSAPLTSNLHVPATAGGAVVDLPVADPVRVAWPDERREASTAQEGLKSEGTARINLAGQGVACTVTAAGDWFLIREAVAGGAKERIAAHGSITLPKGGSEQSFRVENQVFHGAHTLEAVVTWGPPAQPLARLRIMGHRVAAAAFDWCKVWGKPWTASQAHDCALLTHTRLLQTGLR